MALADDDVLLREGLASLLEHSGLEVIGQAGDASQLMALVRVYHPDLAVVDIRMPPTHSTEGLDAARLIREQFPETAVVVLSAHVEVAHAMDLLASGQRTGYLLKSRVTNVPDFIETLNQIVRGGTAIDPTLVQQLVARRRADDPLDALSPREREVLAMMAEGRSNLGIARQLRVTESTIEKHMHSILMKLQLLESDELHRRVLAVLTFLRARLHAYSSAGGPRSPGRQVRGPRPTDRAEATTVRSVKECLYLRTVVHDLSLDSTEPLICLREPALHGSGDSSAGANHKAM